MPKKVFTASDNNFSTHPGDTWGLDEVDTSLDPWEAADLAKVDSIEVGETAYLLTRNVTVKRLR